MLVIADLFSSRHSVPEKLSTLKQNPSTQHIPVLAFAAENAADLQEAARSAGVALVVSEAAIIVHLPQFLDQALQLE